MVMGGEWAQKDARHRPGAPMLPHWHGAHRMCKQEVEKHKFSQSKTQSWVVNPHIFSMKSNLFSTTNLFPLL